MVNKLSYKLRHFHGLIAGSMEAKQLEDDLEAALLERDALKAELDRLPAKWSEDSSLQTWFPITSEELESLRAENKSLKSKIEAARKQEPYAEWKVFNKGGSGQFGQLVSNHPMHDGLKLYASPVPAQQLPDDARYAVDPIYDKGEYYITGAGIKAILKGGENER